MPIESIEGGYHVRMRRRAFAKARTVEIIVETDGPITVHVLPTDQLELFDDSKQFAVYRTKRVNRTREVMKVNIPPEEPWTLILMNTKNDPKEKTAVYWEIIT